MTTPSSRHQAGRRWRGGSGSEVDSEWARPNIASPRAKVARQRRTPISPRLLAVRLTPHVVRPLGDGIAKTPVERCELLDDPRRPSDHNLRPWLRPQAALDLQGVGASEPSPHRDLADVVERSGRNLHAGADAVAVAAGTPQPESQGVPDPALVAE